MPVGDGAPTIVDVVEAARLVRSRRRTVARIPLWLRSGRVARSHPTRAVCMRRTANLFGGEMGGFAMKDPQYIGSIVIVGRTIGIVRIVAVV